MISLNDMAMFVEVGNALSFSQAAQKTGTSNATISRHIQQLELAIGLQLFNRESRNIEFTEAGKMYFEQCKPIIEKAKLADKQLVHLFSHPKGTLRASLPFDFTNTYIAPLLPEFCERYPDIHFDFEFSSKEVDMVKDSFDVAIRVGELKDSNLVIQSLGKLPLYLYASPQYIEIFGEPKTPDELKTRECITIIYKTWQLYRNEEQASFVAESRFKLNNLGTVRSLVCSGLGIALLSEEFAAEEVGQGKLVRIMTEWRGMNVPVYAITESKLLSQKTKTFIDFLKEKLRKNN